MGPAPAAGREPSALDAYFSLDPFIGLAQVSDSGAIESVVREVRDLIRRGVVHGFTNRSGEPATCLRYDPRGASPSTAERPTHGGRSERTSPGA